MSRERHHARLTAVTFLRHGDDVLLLRTKASSDRFVGLWNGIGGHVEAGESPRAAALRELEEEAGVVKPALRLLGVAHETGMGGHAYVVFFFEGRVLERGVEAREGHELAWHPISALAGLDLVPDLRLLLRRLLEASDPLFLVEAYDGGDRLLSLQVDGEERIHVE